VDHRREWCLNDDEIATHEIAMKVAQECGPGASLQGRKHATKTHARLNDVELDCEDSRNDGTYIHPMRDDDDDDDYVLRQVNRSLRPARPQHQNEEDAQKAEEEPAEKQLQQEQQQQEQQQAAEQVQAAEQLPLGRWEVRTGLWGWEGALPPRPKSKGERLAWLRMRNAAIARSSREWYAAAEETSVRAEASAAPEASASDAATTEADCSMWHTLVILTPIVATDDDDDATATTATTAIVGIAAAAATSPHADADATGGLPVLGRGRKRQTTDDGSGRHKAQRSLLPSVDPSSCADVRG